MLVDNTISSRAYKLTLPPPGLNKKQTTITTSLEWNTGTLSTRVWFWHRELLARGNTLSVSLRVDIAHPNALTAAEFQRAGMEVHGKVLQVHGALRMDR